MEQDELDILCVNTQSELARQGVVLVKMIKAGDISAQAFAATHMALYGQMRAIKDYDVTSEDLTDEQLFKAQENIGILINSCNTHI